MTVRRAGLQVLLSFGLVTGGLASSWGPGAAPATAALPANCLASTAAVTCTFTADGTFTVPSSAASLTVVAVGGDGAEGSGAWAGAGGAGALVHTTLPVSPGEGLSVTIGGNAAGAGGGAHGGGSSADGGGGGGATELDRSASLRQRLVVAGGGGGGGTGYRLLATQPPAVGGQGGDAATDGDGDDGASGGGGGQSGANGAAGGAGQADVPQPEFAGAPGIAGAATGTGGDGGQGDPNGLDAGSGGGGGAGYVGGGGGGGGAEGGAGGGGGAGSSFSAGTASVVTAGDGQPRLVISYAVAPVTNHKVAEHPKLKLRSPKRGRLRVTVTAVPAVKGLRVTVYRHVHHRDHSIGKARTNRHGIATFSHAERPGSVLHIRIRLAASSTTKAAASGLHRVKIKSR